MHHRTRSARLADAADVVEHVQKRHVVMGNVCRDTDNSWFLLWWLPASYPHQCMRRRDSSNRRSSDNHQPCWTRFLVARGMDDKLNFNVEMGKIIQIIIPSAKRQHALNRPTGNRLSHNAAGL